MKLHIKLIQQPSKFWELMHGSVGIQPSTGGRSSPVDRGRQTSPRRVRRSASANRSELSKWAQKPLADFITQDGPVTSSVITVAVGARGRHDNTSTFNRLNLSHDSSASAVSSKSASLKGRQFSPGTQLIPAGARPPSSTPAGVVTISGGGSGSRGFQASPAPYATD